MLKNLKQSLILTLFTIILFGFIYPIFIFAIGQLMPDKSIGSPVVINNMTVGFENIGQSFIDDKYFNDRPSAVSYNAASTGGSNKGPSNPEYLADVQSKLDTFLVHNPDVNKKDIPSELVTASGSGIDPNISPEGAYVQVKRISKIRNIDENKIKELIAKNIRKKYLGFLGIEIVNVLKLNLALDNLK
jgi:potassium-transporting ATPase KdpC subunit